MSTSDISEEGLETLIMRRMTGVDDCAPVPTPCATPTFYLIRGRHSGVTR